MGGRGLGESEPLPASVGLVFFDEEGVTGVFGVLGRAADVLGREGEEPLVGSM